MARYVFESKHDIRCCFDCPLMGNDWCSLANRSNFDDRDVIPDWCPLSPDVDTHGAVEKLVRDVMRVIKEPKMLPHSIMEIMLDMRDAGFDPMEMLMDDDDG